LVQTAKKNSRENWTEPVAAAAHAQTIAFLVQKIGPYHHARLEAAARFGRIIVIEFRKHDAVYAWDSVGHDASYEKRLAEKGGLEAALAACTPGVVVCTGYADPEIQRGMCWAMKHMKPLVVCSDSTFDDEPRVAWREMLKRRLVALFHAGLAAGTRSAQYLQYLGIREERIFRHWDVVDNAYFSREADIARRDDHDIRSLLGLSSNFFLCVARFVPKKNLSGLLTAFADYTRRAGTHAWSLVLSGSGPLDNALRRQVEEQGVVRRVHFVGFQQYSALPTYYGLAGALVLPSLSDQWGLVVNEAMAAGLPVVVSGRCGCAPDLVEEGANGFVFDPANLTQLTNRLGEIAGMSTERLAAMGQRSREIMSRFSPESFATGLWAAVECAHRVGPVGVPWATRLLLGRLSRRPVD
jgi:1,2-diacylglycerol 3-alpha-glucosyltransferase